MKRKREEFDFALDKSIPETNHHHDEEKLDNHVPSVLLNELPNEIVSMIADYILEIRDGFSFISTCSSFRSVLDHHELFIEFRLDRELKLLIKRESSTNNFRNNKKKVDNFSTKLSNIAKVIGIKEIRDSKLKDWKHFTDQYRKPYRNAIWKYILDRVSYYSPSFLESGVAISLTSENKDCQFYIGDVLIKCCEIHLYDHNLMAFHDSKGLELINERNIPNASSVKKLKEIIGITEEKVGKSLYRMFSTNTVLNILIISLPSSLHSIRLLDDSDFEDSDDSDEFSYDLEQYNSSEEYEDETEYEFVSD